jgi:hypothetical protein
MNGHSAYTRNVIVPPNAFKEYFSFSTQLDALGGDEAQALGMSLY